jgi:dihydrofolate reductase
MREAKAAAGDADVMVHGAGLAQSLLREGLLDELNLLVHPVVVGGGLTRLFPSDDPSVRLQLQSAQTFKSGVLNLSYRPADG